MRKIPVFILFALMSGKLFSQQAGKIQVIDRTKLITQLKSDVYTNLTENILPFWINKMPDEQNGGFYGRIDGNNKLVPETYKGGILNARILWAFSSAYRVLKDTVYLKMANRAWNYIHNYFFDTTYGGTYLSVNYKGEPLDTRKQIYSQAFFIYALSEYYRVTGDEQALNKAKELFELIEKYACDSVYNGYFEVYSRDWDRIHDKLISEKSNADQKGMNTHLHLLEAYTNLYRVWPDLKLEGRLRNLIRLFQNRLINQQTFHLNYFMNEKWEITSDIDSYGHDIEVSWLLDEAASMLKDSILIADIETLSIKIADAACERLQNDGSFVYEKDKVTGITETKREWWVQAEAVTGLINAYELTSDVSYLLKAVNVWKYIDKHMVDHTNGEWYFDVDEKGNPSGDKAGPWKCPYHNSRMCLEIIERL